MSDEIAKEARRLAKKRAFNPRHFLTVLGRGEYIDFDPHAVPLAQRELVVPALRAMVSTRSSVVRVNAASALLKFGDPLGCASLVESLQTPEREVRRRALDRLISSGIGDRTRTDSLAIDADAILTALEPSLADADRWTRERALMVMGYLATPRAFDRLAMLLEDGRDDVRAEAAIALGRSGQDRGAVFVIENMLARPDSPTRPKHYHLILALEHLCESGDRETQVRAAAVAIRFVRRNLTGGHDVANHGWNCLRAIRKAQLPEEVDLLQDIIASKVEWWVRGEALKRLAQLEGPNGIPRLLSALSDSDLRDAALEGLSSLASASDPTVIETLRQEIARGGAQNISALVRTFLACGGQARELAERVQSGLEPELATTVHWLLNDIGPSQVAAKLQPACGGAEASKATIDEIEETWRTNFSADGVLYSLIGGSWHRLAVVLYKTVDRIADHAELIRDLSASTGDQFTLEDVAQTVESNGELRLLFVYRGVGYSFCVESNGRRLNLRGVLDGLNTILSQLGRDERFIQLYAGGWEAAIVVFVHAEKFLTAARELHIQLTEPA